MIMAEGRRTPLYLLIPLFFLSFAGNTKAQTNPAPSAEAAARFLQQASWGPKASLVAHVQNVGFEGYIDEQFSLPPTPFTVPAPDAKGNIPYRPLQDQFFYNAINGADQLRQRVAFALSQIWVVSGIKITDPRAMVNYLQILQQDAFSNYYNLMYDVTLSPAMGHYLDMVNNSKPNPAAGKDANENYARELMQLFTIGLNQLNPDGSLVVDSSGNPIPTYTQDTVEAFARAFTGWTYAPMPGTPSHLHNPPNWTQPMVAWDSNHDIQPKTLLNGETLPANQTAESDLQAALQNIFQHPNAGPFVCRQLIQHLVTSNPSPSYVARVVGVFNGSPQIPRGDLKSVIKAILLDPEARAGDDTTPATEEDHLREPILFINSLLRSLKAHVELSNGLTPASALLNQPIFFAPSVFNFYSPGYRISGTSINAPEFQLLSTSNAMLRVDFVNSLIYGKIPGVTVDLAPFIQMATGGDQQLDVDTLIQLFNTALMRGQMAPDMAATVKGAVDAASTAEAKAQAVAYLIGSSWQYQVEQ